MSIATVVTEGFGSFGSIAFVVREGFSGADEPPPVVVTEQPDRSDGKPRRRSGDDELTEAEVQWMQRKLQELKQAKTEREKNEAAKALEIALAQAAQDDAAAEAISATIQEKKPEAVLRADYGSVMRDVALLTSITNELERVVKESAAHQRMLEDEDDIEMLLLA